MDRIELGRKLRGLQSPSMPRVGIAASRGPVDEAGAGPVQVEDTLSLAKLGFRL